MKGHSRGSLTNLDRGINSGSRIQRGQGRQAAGHTLPQFLGSTQLIHAGRHVPLRGPAVQVLKEVTYVCLVHTKGGYVGHFESYSPPAEGLIEPELTAQVGFQRGRAAGSLQGGSLQPLQTLVLALASDLVITTGAAAGWHMPSAPISHHGKAQVNQLVGRFRGTRNRPGPKLGAHRRKTTLSLVANAETNRHRPAQSS